jgi:hypothetical protein
VINGKQKEFDNEKAVSSAALGGMEFAGDLGTHGVENSFSRRHGVGHSLQ